MWHNNLEKLEKLMDRESMKTAESYRQMTEQHFHGGFFSDSVRAEGERISRLPEEEKRRIFCRLFNNTYELAEQLQDRPEFNEENASIDLSAEGLGTVAISLYYFSEEEAKKEDAHPCKGIMVETVFDPTPEKKSEWINAEGDSLGLQTAGPTMVTVDQAPDGWEEHIYADPDGSFPTEDHPHNIDNELLRILDARETLNTTLRILNTQVFRKSGTA